MSTNEKNLKHLMDCMMIDTMGLRVANVPNVQLPKKFARVNADHDSANSTAWEKGRLKSEAGEFPSLRVGAIKSNNQLLVEGSNAVHYQGHNIVSSGDAVMTAFSMLDAVRRQHPLHLENIIRPWGFMKGEGIAVTRIDTPVMLQLPDGLQIGAIINALALAGISAGLVTTLFPCETVYFDQHSQLESLKAYHKAIELQQNKRPYTFSDTENGATLRKLAQQMVRFEAVYRLKSLTRRFAGRPVTPAMLSPKVLATMFMDLLDKYNLHGSLRRRLNTEELWQIRSPYRTTVALWQRGEDMKTIFNNDDGLLKSHRRVINKEYGIDILDPHPGEIEVPIELGEILCVENFVPVPIEIRSDPELFYQRDMYAEWKEYCAQNGLSSVTAAYVDPYELEIELPGGGADF